MNTPYGQYGQLGAFWNKAPEEPEIDPDCQGAWAYTPACAIKASHAAAAETGEAAGKALVAAAWKAVRIPLIIAGVGVVVYVAVDKAGKARKARR